MLKPARKGTVLLLLLTTIFLVLVLAGVISWLILSQSRVNQHQIERTKAYYAAMGGINIAMEKLRGGSWNTAGTATYNICRYTNATGAGDDLPDCQARCDVCDFDIPYNLTLTLTNMTTYMVVNATANYTYVP